jgi:hypothetical protein
MIMMGWVMTVLFAVFMLAASVAPKLLRMSVAVESLERLGWPKTHLLLIAILELSSTLLFVVPATSLVGAILMTGLLGGALASHLRSDSPMFSHTLFGIYLGAFMWIALWLREPDFRVALSIVG